MYATIMGQSGMEFGLMLFRGEDADLHLAEMLRSDPRECDIADDVGFIGFSMTRFSEVPPFARSFLKKAQAPSRRESVVPCIIVREPGKQPRGLAPDEARRLLFVLKGILKAHRDGLLKPESLFSAETVTALYVEGDPIEPTVTVESRPNEATRQPNVFQLQVVPTDLREHPRRFGRWLIGFPVLPVEIADDDRTFRMVLVIDEQSGMALSGEATHGGIPHAVELIHEALRGKNTAKTAGLPSEIHVAHAGLFKALVPTFDALGVNCRYVPGIPMLESVFGELLEHLDGTAQPGAAPPPRKIATMPEPKDTDG